MFKTLKETAKYHLDRVIAWSSKAKAREQAYKDLAAIVGRKEAKEIRLLAEYLEPQGYNPTLLLETACLKAYSGHPMWNIKADLILVTDEREGVDKK